MSRYKPVKIALLGELRAGKDTVAQIIVDKLKEINKGSHTQKVAFADGIHKVIRLVMPEVYELGKPRQQLQHIGQSIRELDENVWVNMLFNSFEYTFADSQDFNILITDVRQPNEAERVQAEGFKIIKVVADKEVRIQRAVDAGDNFSPEMLEHETEKVLHTCSYDYLIDNSFSMEELERSVSEILEEVLEIHEQVEQGSKGELYIS